MSTKKKTMPAPARDKKPAAKKPAAAKKAAPSKPSKPVKRAVAAAKAPAPAKKAAGTAKKAPAPKKQPAVSAKKPVSKPKTAVREPVVQKAAAPVAEAKTPPKKVAPSIRTPRPPRPPETPSEPFSNTSQDFAFAFAEERKRAQRAQDDAEMARQHAIKLTRRPDTRVKGKNTQKFPAADLAQFRKALLSLRQIALAQSDSLRTIALEQTEERGGEDEDCSDAFLRLQSLGQVDLQNRNVQKIDAALARIEDGTYGVCENCGQLIRKQRLQHHPFVHTCIECQTLLERR